MPPRKRPRKSGGVKAKSEDVDLDEDAAAEDQDEKADENEEEPYLRVSYFPVVSGRMFGAKRHFVLMEEYCEEEIDGEKRQFFKACKWSPMLNRMCGLKKGLHSGWPLKQTPLLSELMGLRNEAAGKYKTKVRDRTDVPPAIQIQAPQVGPVPATDLTVLSDGGRVLWVSLEMDAIQYLITALRWQVENNVSNPPIALPKLPNGVTRATLYGKIRYRVFVNYMGGWSVKYKYFTTIEAAVQCKAAVTK